MSGVVRQMTLRKPAVVVYQDNHPQYAAAGKARAQEEGELPAPWLWRMAARTALLVTGWRCELGNVPVNVCDNLAVGRRQRCGVEAEGFTAEAFADLASESIKAG